MKKLFILLFSIFVLANNVCSIHIIIANTTLYLNESGFAVIDNSFDDIINDDISISSISIDKNIFSSEEIGENWITLKVIDVNNNTDYFSSIITVLDTLSPVVNCKNATVYLNEIGTVKIDNSLINNGISDNSSILSISLDKVVFTSEDIGENWVTLTVIDEYGNIGYSLSVVTVLDYFEPIKNLNSHIVEIESEVIYVPTAFTPNNDGINDVFTPVFDNINTINYEFIIYNLKNEIVFKTNTNSEVWDGKFRGIEVPTGNYVWTLSSSSKNENNIQSKKGYVKLIR